MSEGRAATPLLRCGSYYLELAHGPPRFPRTKTWKKRHEADYTGGTTLLTYLPVKRSRLLPGKCIRHPPDGPGLNAAPGACFCDPGR